MGLFCDCFRRRSLVDSYPKPGYARIVEGKEPPSHSFLPIDIATLSSRRRSWEIGSANDHSRLLPSHLTMINEKELLEPSLKSTTSSPRSSTISLPSTRVTTALTIITDNTSASHVSRRSHESGATFGAPPSYNSRRSTSRRRSNSSSWDRHHPVLAEDWFDQFREP